MLSLDKIRVAAKCKAWDDDDISAASTYYNRFRKLLLSMSDSENDAQSSTESQQGEKSLDIFEHEDEESGISETQSGAPEDKAAIHPGSQFSRNRNPSRGFIHHPNFGRQVYVKPHVDHDKCGAEDEAGSPDPPLGSPAVHSMTTRGHHAKSTSGGLSVGKDQGFGNQSNQANDFQYRRDTHGTTTPLWDPNTDNPNTGKAFDKGRYQSLPNNPSRLNPSKDHGPKSRNPSLLHRDRRPQALKARREQPMSNEPETLVLENPRKPLTLKMEQAPSGGDSPEMLLQPDTRPISHEQLVVEVKGIYAGLVMVEAKCIDIDERQSTALQEKNATKRTNLRNDQWQSLIALHKTLLHEHHDFFLASQLPSASPALSRLATKYSMPARMWRHGIHGFLEVLRHKLPDTLEHMLAFLYIAYSMMALLYEYETVSTFEDTWIECLGNFSTYSFTNTDVLILFYFRGFGEISHGY